jgi:hypothetical protein
MAFQFMGALQGKDARGGRSRGVYGGYGLGGFGLGYYGGYYGYVGYYGDGGYGGCYVARQRVMTRYGWRIRTVDVCE